MANNTFQPENSSTTANRSADACKAMKPTDFASNEDFISRLPNEVLTHILSLMPTESSVATSVLSKRWNRVWTLVPNLDFFTNGRYQRSSSCPVKVAQFVNFVDRVLFFNMVLSVRNVRLWCFDDWDISAVLDWINTIVTREAEIIDLRLPVSFVDDLKTSRMYSVPDRFFNQKNLVKLKLEHIVLKVPSSVCFPSLETIVLKAVYFGDDDNDEAMKNLLSGCSVLKSLCIHSGFLTDKEIIYICSKTLNDLEIDMCYDGYLGNKVVIDAPNLRCIDLTEEAGTTFEMVNISSLVKATTCFRHNFGESSRVFNERLHVLLQKIELVKELFLRTSTIASLDDVPTLDGFLPMFNRLTFLSVEIIGGYWWPLLPRLFHSMPNLIHLHADLYDVDEFDDDTYEPLELPPCLLSSLEKVEIVHSNADYVEMGLISYILKHAIVLKRLSIQTAFLNLGEEANVIEELQTLQKSAGACEIEYKNRDMRDQRISLHHSVGLMLQSLQSHCGS